MSSGGVQPSSDVLTLSHDVLQLAGQQKQPVTAHLPLGSLTPPFCSRANTRLSPLLLLTSKQPPSSFLPVIPRAANIFHIDCTRKPLQPTSMGSSHPLSLQWWIRSWNLVPFLSWALLQPTFHGTVSSTRIMFLASAGHMTKSGLRDTWTTWGQCSFPTKSTLISHDWANCRRFSLFYMEARGFSPSFLNWMRRNASGWIWHFFFFFLPSKFQPVF